MPTNYNIPAGGTVNWGGYLGIADPTATFGVFPSVLNQGGFQEMPTITEMHEIPSRTTGGNGGLEPNPNWGAIEITDDGWGTGRRRVGMLVSVLDGGSGTPKLFRLIPNGYFGNGGNLGVADWGNLTDTQKYELLDPVGLYNASGSPFAGWNVNTPTGAAGDCWVELDFGSDGNPIDTVVYTESTGSLKITLTHDGSGSGTPIEFEVFVDNYTSALADTSTNVPTAVGGFKTSDTVAGLNGLTQNQMWDKLLFPTVNPTGSGASVTLNDSYNLIEAETNVNMVLTTSANLGTLSNPAGSWAGPVNAAVIDDIGVGGMAQQVLNVGPNPTDIDDLTIAYITKLGINKFRLTGSFDQGPMPLDSTGADYPGVRFNAQDKTNTTQFEGVWPIYIGTSQDLGGNNYDFEKRGLVSQSTPDISCTQNYGENAANNLWHRIAVPQAMVQGGDITIQLDAGPLGYQPSYPGGWVKTSTTFDVHNDAQNVPYFLYTKQAPQGGQATWIVNW